MNIEKQISEKGFIDIAPEKNINLQDEILKLKKEKNAIILAHYYVTADLQEIADFVGDSLALSQQAAKTEADIIVFLGVHFMAETAKTLSPSKKVLLPDLKAGCSLADSCPAPDFKTFVEAHPNHVVISYVNTTAAVKALTDIICTSSNAKVIVESVPKDKKIIFGPDRNLGNYINALTGREMVLWDGACHVHHEFSLERILKLKQEQPEAKIIAHPETQKPVQEVADYVGSTSGMLQFTIDNEGQIFIVATEPGVIHQMKKASPNKTFIPAPGDDPDCACNDCEYMKMHSMTKLYNCLKYEQPEIHLDEEIRLKALIPIQAMLDISAKNGL